MLKKRQGGKKNKKRNSKNEDSDSDSDFNYTVVDENGKIIPNEFANNNKKKNPENKKQNSNLKKKASESKKIKKNIAIESDDDSSFSSNEIEDDNSNIDDELEENSTDMQHVFSQNSKSKSKTKVDAVDGDEDENDDEVEEEEENENRGDKDNEESKNSDIEEIDLDKEENPQRTINSIDDLIKNKKKKSLVKLPLSQIACKMKRLEMFQRRKVEIARLKKELREARRQEEKEKGLEAQKPITVDDQREIDDDFILEQDDDLQNEENIDELSWYFNSAKEPKIMMTTCERPSGKLFDLLKEMKITIPNCYFYPRRNYSIKEITQYARNRDFTALLIFREHRKKPNRMILINLPEGPTATFKLTNFRTGLDIINYANPSEHKPELILKNFDTAVGRRIGRSLASLFPQDPEFKGRRLVTFYNKRDFIFLRHHRYIFKNGGERVGLQEIGPRLTLKLLTLQKGVWDNQAGEYEWIGKDDLYVSRKKFYLQYCNKNLYYFLQYLAPM